MEQQIDPMQTNINWEEFRERQKEGAAESVRSALVLDEIARREAIAVPESEIEAEVARYAERSGRTTAAVRARLEKEGGLGRLFTALRRERPSPSCSPARRQQNRIRSNRPIYPLGPGSAGSSVVQFRKSTTCLQIPSTFTGKTVPDCLCLNACNSFRWWSNRPTAANALTTFFRGC